MSIAGQDWELMHGYLAGRNVTIARSLVDRTAAPWVEHDGKRLPLAVVDAKANAKRPRPKRAKRGIDAVPFDPPKALVDVALSRHPKGGR